MTTYYDALTQEQNESQHSDDAVFGPTPSPSEVAGKDETKPETAPNYLDLEEWEQTLLDTARLDGGVLVPLDVFDDLIAVATEYIDLVDAERNRSLVTKSPSYKHSRIRVQLSRPLTVAESEKLSTDHHSIGGRLNVSRRHDDGFLFKLRVSPNRTHVWVDADLPSRPLYDVVAAALDQHFVNVYPTAVRTFTEYHA